MQNIAIYPVCAVRCKTVFFYNSLFFFFIDRVIASFCTTTLHHSTICRSCGRVKVQERLHQHTQNQELFISALWIMWREDLWVYESCRVCLLYNVASREDVEPLREQGQRKDAPQRRCYKARLRLEPRVAMYGCLCLYRPQLWKATVLFTVKGSDGPPLEEGPLCPSLCVCVCTWVKGGGERVCLVQTLKTSVLQHTRPSKTCLIALIWSSVYVNHWCVCVRDHRINDP